jgi:hypothetical protein
MSLEAYFTTLVQNSGAKEIILVGDYTKLPTKKQRRETHAPERPDTGPPTRPKRKESCGPPMCPKRKETYALKDCYDEITAPGGSSSRKERCECRGTPPSKTKFLDVAPRFPLKRRGSCDDVAAFSAFSACIGRNQSNTKKSLQGILDEVEHICAEDMMSPKSAKSVEHVCAEDGIGAPYNMMSPRSARWSARPAIFQERNISDSAIVQEGSDSTVLLFR